MFVCLYVRIFHHRSNKNNKKLKPQQQQEQAPTQRRIQELTIGGALRKWSLWNLQKR